MYKELIINDTEHETRVALLEDGTIVWMMLWETPMTNTRIYLSLKMTSV